MTVQDKMPQPNRLDGSVSFTDLFPAVVQSIVMSTNTQSFERWLTFTTASVAPCSLWWEDENDDSSFILDGEPA